MKKFLQKLLIFIDEKNVKINFTSFGFKTDLFNHLIDFFKFFIIHFKSFVFSLPHQYSLYSIIYIYKIKTKVKI